MKLKNIYKTMFILLIFCGINLQSPAQSENKFIRHGNKSFEAGDFKEAEIDYRKALDKNQQSIKGEYNLSGAIYQQENFEEAQKLYEQLASANLSPQLKAMTYHNLGNSFLKMQQPEPAIEAYKNALRNNPGDLDTKYNLEFAKKMLKQQQQQQQNKDQNKDQENKDQENKDQKNKDQQQKQDQNKDQEKKDQQQNQQNQQQSQENQAQQQPQQMKQISKEDAERMLQALQDNEKKTLEKLKLEKLKNAKKVKTEKDW